MGKFKYNGHLTRVVGGEIGPNKKGPKQLGLDLLVITGLSKGFCCEGSYCQTKGCSF